MEGIKNTGFVKNEENYQMSDEPTFATLEIEVNSQMEENITKFPSEISAVADIGLHSKSKCNGVENGNQTSLSANLNENVLSRTIIKFRIEAITFIRLHRTCITVLFKFGVAILYHIYLIYGLIYNVSNDLPLGWCNGVGVLLILTGIAYWSVLYYFVLKPALGNLFGQIQKTRYAVFWRALWNLWYIKGGLYIIIFIAFLTLLIIDTRDQPRRLISALGIPVFIMVGLMLSKYPGHVKWALISWSLVLQFLMGLMILRWESGRNFLDCISGKVVAFVNFSTVGSDFVYGYLSSGKPTDEITFPTLFVFRGLSVIFFFGFVISLLYHYGVMTWVIVKLGWILSVTIGTTAAESMNAAANIFMGQTEAPLLIKPFINDLTKSELHAIMTGGFSTAAGAALAIYINFGISPSYLLAASAMAAPAGLCYSKLIYPETKTSRTKTKDIMAIQAKPEGNALDAAAHGAIQGVTLIGCIIANIIAFVSFVAFLNGIISWFGALVGVADLSFEIIMGKLFIPIAWLIGIDSEECESVALLLGLKTIANEFIAYKRLGEMTLSPRSKALASYALCSFANVGSIGVQLGGLGTLAPDRRNDISKIIGSAFLSGTIVGFLNAAMAGMLLSEPGYREWNLSRNLTVFVLPVVS